MPTEDEIEREWTFPSRLAAVQAQLGSRRCYEIIRDARRYRLHDPWTFAALTVPHMESSRIRARIAREYLFGLIGDGTLEDCPPTWKW